MALISLQKESEAGPWGRDGPGYPCSHCLCQIRSVAPGCPVATWKSGSDIVAVPTPGPLHLLSSPVASRSAAPVPSAPDPSLSCWDAPSICCEYICVSPGYYSLKFPCSLIGAPVGCLDMGRWGFVHPGSLPCSQDTPVPGL